MILINTNHIDKFKKFNREYMYMVSRGIYLAFDLETLEYIGIEMFYLADPKKYNPLVDNKLNELISKDILIVR